MGKTYSEYSEINSRKRKEGKTQGKTKKMKYGVAKETVQREIVAATQR
jgi:hypothetical protein